MYFGSICESTQHLRLLRFLFTVFLRRDHRFCTQLGDGISDVLGVVGFVSYDELALVTFEQGFSLGRFVRLSCGET